MGAMEELWMSQGAQGSESHLTITGYCLDHAGTQPVEGTLSCLSGALLRTPVRLHKKSLAVEQTVLAPSSFSRGKWNKTRSTSKMCRRSHAQTASSTVEL